MAELPTGWGQPNSSTGNPLLSVSCLLHQFLKGDYFQSFHLSQLLPLAGSGDKSFYNDLKWKCWPEKSPLPDKRHVLSWLPGQSKAACHVPSLTSEEQRRYITTTAQLNSITFSLGECRRYTFKTKHIRCCLAGRTSLIRTVGSLSTQAGFSALTTLTQDCCWLPRDCSSLSPQLLGWPLDHRQVLSQPWLCSDVGEGTLPKKAFVRQDEVSSTAGSLLGQPCSSCSLAQMCCFQISITAWVNKQ